MRGANPTVVTAFLAIAVLAAAAALDGQVEQSRAHAAAAPAGRVVDQRPGPPFPTCNVPTNVGQQPERAAEMRLARDGYGTFWQIQSGCRHQVIPFVMNAALLRALPVGEDISFVSYGFPAPVPTPAPLGVPAYARLPEQWQPAPTPIPTIVPGGTPGYLAGYMDRVLVVEDGEPNVIYLLQGGLRHRVLVFYPFCVVDRRGLPAPLCDREGPDAVLDLSRAGDPISYLLPRRRDTDCSRLFTDIRVPPATNCTAIYQGLGMPADRAALLANFVATIAEIPLGEPAPGRDWSGTSYGWAQGEALVVSDAIAPQADKCARRPCSTRYESAQAVPLAAYDKDPGAFEGIDVRMEGIACQVQYSRETNATYFILRLGDIAVPAVARGRTAQRDPEFGSNTRVEIGASTTTRGETTGASLSGQLVVFEYRVIGGGACPTR